LVGRDERLNADPKFLLSEAFVERAFAAHK
jgi:hypothetical protein